MKKSKVLSGFLVLALTMAAQIASAAETCTVEKDPAPLCPKMRAAYRQLQAVQEQLFRIDDKNDEIEKGLVLADKAQKDILNGMLHRNCETQKMTRELERARIEISQESLRTLRRCPERVIAISFTKGAIQDLEDAETAYSGHRREAEEVTKRLQKLLDGELMSNSSCH